MVTTRRHDQIDVEISVARAKREILEDIAAGYVPRDVASFSELHDYRDANEYGGLCEDGDHFGAYAWTLEETDPCLFANKVQDAVDEWIKAGGAR